MTKHVLFIHTLFKHCVKIRSVRLHFENIVEYSASKQQLFHSNICILILSALHKCNL